MATTLDRVLRAWYRLHAFLTARRARRMRLFTVPSGRRRCRTISDVGTPLEVGQDEEEPEVDGDGFEDAAHVLGRRLLVFYVGRVGAVFSRLRDRDSRARLLLCVAVAKLCGDALGDPREPSGEPVPWLVLGPAPHHDEEDLLGRVVALGLGDA